MTIKFNLRLAFLFLIYSLPSFGQMTITTMPESSPPWPAGSREFYGIPAQTDDPLGPWHNQAAVYRGYAAGGSSEQLNGAWLVYRFRIDFAQATAVTSVTVHGSGDYGSGGNAAVFRLLDANRNVLAMRSTSDVSCCPPSTPFNASNTYSVNVPGGGAIGTTFFIDEFDYSTNARYRDHIVVAFSQANCPTVSKILSNHGGNAGSVTVQVLGCGFAPGASVKLTGLGADIAGSPPVITTQLDLTTTFNLIGAQPGARSVLVTNADGSSATLSGAFTIEQSGAPDIWVDVVGRSSLRAGQQQTYYLLVGNRGNIDAVSSRVWVAVPSYIVWSSSSHTPTAQGQMDGYEFLAFDLPVTVSAQIAIPLLLTAPDNPIYAHQVFDVQAWKEEQ